VNKDERAHFRRKKEARRAELLGEYQDARRYLMYARRFVEVDASTAVFSALDAFLYAVSPWLPEWRDSYDAVAAAPAKRVFDALDFFFEAANYRGDRRFRDSDRKKLDRLRNTWRKLAEKCQRRAAMQQLGQT